MFPYSRALSIAGIHITKLDFLSNINKKMFKYQTNEASFFPKI